MHSLQNPIRFVTDSWLPALFCAATITASLFLLMNYLIQTPELAVPENPVRPVPNPVLKERIIQDRLTPPPPKKQPVTQAPPVRPPVDIAQIEGQGGVQFGRPDNTFEGGGDIDFAPTGAPIARVMIAPDYPHRAAQKGIEGFVIARFDITETGATENIEILDAVPADIFDKAAVRAIARWKFTPYEVSGEVRPFYGMSKRLTFELDK